MLASVFGNFALGIRSYLRDRSLTALYAKWVFSRRFRKVTAGKNYCYISRYCIGGRFYQIEARRYTSPTVGMWITTPEFLTFCSDLQGYLSKDVEYDPDLSAKEGHPVGRLGDVTLLFLHYFTFAGAKHAWEKRTQRIDPDKLVIVTNTEGEQELQAALAGFRALPFKRKVMFTNVPGDHEDQVIYVPGFAAPDGSGDLYNEFELLNQKEVSEKFFAILA